MSILPVTLYGDKILKKKAKSVQGITPAIEKLVDDMFHTMKNADGMGLAANQVGRNKSIFVIDLSPVKGYENFKPVVFINPRIEFLSEEKVGIEEGCLSVPGIREEVIRPEGIRIAYEDINKKENIIEYDELFARVIQHEYDHLHGLFFTDRLEEETQKILKRSLSKIKSRKIETDYPVTEKEK